MLLTMLKYGMAKVQLGSYRFEKVKIKFSLGFILLKMLK